MKTAIALFILGFPTGLPVLAGTVDSLVVAPDSGASTFAATGTVEAVRQGTLGAQVSGRVDAVLIGNGDEVAAGQALIRIDADEARQSAAASHATATGADARLASARADYERAQKLRARDYISDAAMQRAESAWRTAQADAEATRAEADAASTRAGWHTVRAPYAAHVTGLWVSAGDMVTPGRPLVGLYAPGALRVVARVPETVGPRLRAGNAVQLELPGSAPLAVTTWRIVPAIDPATHSIEVRLDLPPGTRADPGMFAKLLLPLRDALPDLRIPTRAIVQRSEVTAVYVLDDRGLAHLRQVRLGAVAGDRVSVLSGLRRGERIVANPNGAGTP
jgi:membrane fusion protein, multidrug efflux system